MHLETVAPHVHAVLQPEGGVGASNSGFVASGGGLVVDTFWDVPRTRRMLDLYVGVAGAVAERPRRCVNTHHNGDHAWGNQVLAEVGTELIGHERCAERFGVEDPAVMAGLGRIADAPPHLQPMVDAFARFDFDSVVLTPPTSLIDDDGAVLDLDGTAVELLSVGPAHTAGDVAVWLPDDGVLFTGDVLFHQCTPLGWEGTFAGWIGALERLAALEPAVVVPGHGPLASADDLLELRDYLAHVQVEARAHWEAGRSLLDAARRIELGRFAGWDEPERIIFQLHRAYRELEGDAWDAPVPVMRLFGDMGTLRAEGWRGAAPTHG